MVAENPPPAESAFGYAAGQDTNKRKGQREVRKPAHAPREFLRVAHLVKDFSVVLAQPFAVLHSVSLCNGMRDKRSLPTRQRMNSWVASRNLAIPFLSAAGRHSIHVERGWQLQLQIANR
jgi:hypothetical protein